MRTEKHVLEILRERETEELARWIVEHGAERRPEIPAEVGVPLYLPVPEYIRKGLV